MLQRRVSPSKFHVRWYKRYDSQFCRRGVYIVLCSFDGKLGEEVTPLSLSRETFRSRSVSLSARCGEGRFSNTSLRKKINRASLKVHDEPHMCAPRGTSIAETNFRKFLRRPLPPPNPPPPTLADSICAERFSKYTRISRHVQGDQITHKIFVVRKKCIR